MHKYQSFSLLLFPFSREFLSITSIPLVSLYIFVCLGKQNVSAVVSVY
jgi:hypothetical protein